MFLPDLHKVVSDQFAAIVESGTIQTMIEKHLSESINEILKEQLRSYGAFGKTIKPLVEQALQIDDLRELPSYGQFMCNIIRKNVDQQLHGEYAKKLADDIAALFMDAPAEIAFEDLIEKFKEHTKNSAFSELDYRMTLHLEYSQYGSWYVAMDKEDGKEKYRCALRFHVNKEGEMFALTIDDSDMKKDLFIGPFNEFERLLFRMYVQGTKVRIEPHSEPHDFSLQYTHDD